MDNQDIFFFNNGGERQTEPEDKQRKHLKKHRTKIKEECKRKKIKKEKHDKSDNSKSSRKSKEKSKDKMDEQNLMSVLELLELQARARAIRSQLALESSKKSQEQENNETKSKESDNDDAVIIESPKNIEIVITSSESENEDPAKINTKNLENLSEKQTDNVENNGNENESDCLNKCDTKETDNLNENINTQEIGNEQTSCSRSDVSEITINDELRNSEAVNKNKDEAETCNKNRKNETEDIIIQEEKMCSESRNKVTNIESVVIIPAQITDIPVSDSSKDNEFGETNNKSKGNKRENESIETSEVATAMAKNEKPTSISQNKNKIKKVTNEEPNKSDSYEESDGIIINMEQSEIDCIISD